MRLTPKDLSSTYNKAVWWAVRRYWPYPPKRTVQGYGIEDVHQLAVSKMIEDLHANKYDPARSSPGTWIPLRVKSIINNVLDHIHAKHHPKPLSSNALRLIPDPNGHPSRVEVQELMDAIKQFPRAEQEVLLGWAQGFSTEEIAHKHARFRTRQRVKQIFRRAINELQYYYKNGRLPSSVAQRRTTQARIKKSA